MFSPYKQFKKTKKTKKYSFIIDDQNKDIVTSMNWKRYFLNLIHIIVIRNSLLFTIKSVTNS